MNDGPMTKNPAATDGHNSLSPKADSFRANPLHPHVDSSDRVMDTIVKVFDAKDKVVKQGSATLETVRQFAKANPFKALAIAFAVGYVGMRITRPLRWL